MIRRENLKRKLVDVILEETKAAKLSADRFKHYKEQFAKLADVMDVGVDAVEAEVAEVQKKKKTERENELKTAILEETKDRYPEVLMTDLTFHYSKKGIWWTGDYCNYCYGRDDSGHCNDPDHSANYEEELIILNKDGKVVYHHCASDEPDCFDHSSEKVNINPDLDKSFCYEIVELNWINTTKSLYKFSQWICEVHKIVYELHLDDPEGANGYPTEFMKRFLTKKIFGTYG
jgi:hypothetical protein